MNKKHISFNKILNIIYTCFIIFIIICYIGIAIKGIKNYPSTNTVIKDNKLVDFNTGWIDKNNNPIILNHFTKNDIFKENKKQTIYHKISPDEVKAGDSLCFRSLSCMIDAYIDDKPIISTTYKEMLFSCKSPGSVWNFYKFKKSDIGKTIKMNIELSYNDSSCYIENMYVGDATYYLVSYIKNNIISLITITIIFFLGVLFIGADIYINLAKPVKEHVLLHIGLLAIYMAIWTLFSTHIIELLYPGTSQSVQFISCVLLFFIPYQALFFIRSVFNVKEDKYIKINGLLILILCGIASLLQIFNIYDYHETLLLTHLSFITGIFTLVITLTITHLKGGIFVFNLETQKKKRTFIIATVFIISFLVLGVIFDMILFYNEDQVNVGIFTRYSVVFVIIYLGLLASHNLYDIIRQLNENELTKKLAYIDNLTNLGNRTAFMRDFANLNKTLSDQDEIGIITFDINNLKIVNDTQGHFMGDELICSAANAINKSFSSEYTNVYRIGGDEFVAIIKSKDARKLLKISELALESALQLLNTNNKKCFNVSIAYGCAFYDSSNKNTVNSLDDILKESDSLMYKQKEIMKKNMDK